MIRIDGLDVPNVKMGIRWSEEDRPGEPPVLIPGLLTYQNFVRHQAHWNEVNWTSQASKVADPTSPIGRQYARPERGLLSRPTLLEVMNYRAHVDEAKERLFANHLASEPDQDLLAVIELGTHHEQQHQELMLMDIKHVFSCNPLRPAYGDLPIISEEHVPPLNWLRFDGELGRSRSPKERRRTTL